LFALRYAHNHSISVIFPFRYDCLTFRGQLMTVVFDQMLDGCHLSECVEHSYDIVAKFILDVLPSNLLVNFVVVLNQTQAPQEL